MVDVNDEMTDRDERQCLLVVVALMFWCACAFTQDFLSTGDYVSVNWNKSSIHKHVTFGDIARLL